MGRVVSRWRLGWLGECRGGGSRAGGWGGWGGPVQTLSDGFANPVTVSALITGREGTVDPLSSVRYKLPAPANTADTIERWEPWVRMSVALQELCGRLRFYASANAAELFDRGRTNAATEYPIVKLISPRPEAFERQLCMVLRWAELREERMAEVLSQLENQTAMVSSVPYLHPTRTPRTLELLAVALQFAVAVEMRFKHALACWRPVEYSPHVQPMITTPGHGSLPSGHATQAYIVVEVLTQLLALTPADQHPAAVQLQRQAARIATNRVIAGVHFPVDNIAGRMLGVTLGQFFVRCARPATAQWLSGVFDGTKVFHEVDVELHPEIQPLSGDDAPAYYDQVERANLTIEAEEVLRQMWIKATEEWKGRSFSSFNNC